MPRDDHLLSTLDLLKQPRKLGLCRVDVVVLSYSLWTRQFGADASVAGRTITLNSTPYTVRGVTPANFKGTATVGDPDVIWIPLIGHRPGIGAARVRT